MSSRSLDLAVAQALRDGARLRLALLEKNGADIARACDLVTECVTKGHKVLFCGNGGSAADAQHLAAELVGRYVVERKGLPGIALTVDTSILTAVGNDYGFDKIFSRQVEALGAEGDVLVAITTSGGSPNVRAAIEVARQKGMKVLGLTGAKGTAFAEICDVGICVPSLVTARIQECHLTIGHILCEAIDAATVPAKAEGGITKRFTKSAKELSRGELEVLRDQWKKEKKTVAWTNGVFDVLHVGHLHQLRSAKAHGDVLVVGVNTDETVRAAKGADRPIFPLEERVEMLSAIDCVDYVHVFPEATPEEALKVLRPDAHVKGADYAPPNGKPIPEKALVEGYGGKIVFVPLVEGRSTTSTLERLRK
jgi:phosphoheptose isomerase